MLFKQLISANLALESSAEPSEKHGNWLRLGSKAPSGDAPALAGASEALAVRA
jgi:hypothetical protein